MARFGQFPQPLRRCRSTPTNPDQHLSGECALRIVGTIDPAEVREEIERRIAAGISAAQRAMATSGPGVDGSIEPGSPRRQRPWRELPPSGLGTSLQSPIRDCERQKKWPSRAARRNRLIKGGLMLSQEARSAHSKELALRDVSSLASSIALS
jgi:hypothetical protein